MNRILPRGFWRPTPRQCAQRSGTGENPPVPLPRHHQPIVAIATAAGRGAVGIVRVSGRDLARLTLGLCGRPLAPRHATHTAFLDAQGAAIDRGLALYFPAPHSYTGEDVLELQAHGGPVVLQLLLNWTRPTAPRACPICGWPSRANSLSARFSTTKSIWPRPRPWPT